MRIPEENPAHSGRSFRTACFSLLLSLTTFAGAKAEYSYTTDNGQVTITGYTGPGGQVNIPDTIDGLPVTSIHSQAFFDRSHVATILIPNSITNIGEMAFEKCINLNAITVEALNSYYSSMEGILFNKSKTELVRYPGGRGGNYTVPHGVTSIRFSAFSYSPGLTNVFIPGSVTSIGSHAFSECPKLTELYFLGNRPRASLPVVFANTPATIYYLPGTTTWDPTFVNRPTVLWRPLMQLPSSLSNQFGFTISWASDRVVVVEACTNLDNPVWTPVSTNILTVGSSYFSDPEWSKFPNRVYRLRVP